ncbi:hypothetical protein NPIL_607181 [Nephila pilipes]|uniref:Uncharacterized protein n=1 Tax=Nephila pilipes TaxID=299642 RepID=A0A8X6IUL7_NEPPI|nr:hypothetical protein NPIL_607181 [Nephila pilipes]
MSHSGEDPTLTDSIVRVNYRQREREGAIASKIDGNPPKVVRGRGDFHLEGELRFETGSFENGVNRMKRIGKPQEGFGIHVDGSLKRFPHFTIGQFTKKWNWS